MTQHRHMSKLKNYFYHIANAAMDVGNHPFPMSSDGMETAGLVLRFANDMQEAIQNIHQVRRFPCPFFPRD